MQIVKNRTLFFRVACCSLALGALPLSACDYLKARSARAEYVAYQQALATGNLREARRALTNLTRTEQDVPEYWIELGKLQLQMGDSRRAYNSLLRAHELDRTNVPVLGTMAKLALLSGDLDLANQQAKALTLLSPDHPAVILVRGYTELRSGNLDKAATDAEALLADDPSDSFAQVLKARVLVARDKTDDAIALLERQHEAAPEDPAAVRALAAIYQSRDDWRNLARVQLAAHRLQPRDREITQSGIEASLRAGNIVAARQLSAPYLTPKTRLPLLEATLDAWAIYAPKGVILPDAVRLARAASGDARACFANYFNAIGKPVTAASLVGGSHLPITHDNARLNAVYAQSLVQQGKVDEGKRLFDLVLDREPDQAEALRGRSSLEARSGQTKQAILDAQRLVTVSPDRGQDRLILAQAYQASNNKRAVLRTLWDAFQDLPANEQIYSALRSALASTGDADGARRVNEEFADRKKAKLSKALS
jgi:predicted Zn-dependent protease